MTTFYHIGGAIAQVIHTPPNPSASESSAAEPGPSPSRRRSPGDALRPAPGGPGTRPWAWWRFEAKVPRLSERLESVKKNELRVRGWFSETAWRAFFGCPAAGYVATEGEAAYLSRHRLFLPGEEKAMQGSPGPALDG